MGFGIGGLRRTGRNVGYDCDCECDNGFFGWDSEWIIAWIVIILMVLLLIG